MDAAAAEGPALLNVNDFAPSRYVSTRHLRRAGFRVLEAETGEGALAMALAHRPALVLLDMRLPDVDGLEVCRRLKADPATAAVRVLHTSSGDPTPALLHASREAGADGFLPQPFTAEGLAARVRALLAG
jgi:DNA-binding response OmpR family regulator